MAENETLEQLLRELLAVQVTDLALRLEARSTRVSEPLDGSYLREALVLLERGRRALAAGAEAAAAGEEELQAGDQRNLAEAKKMSLKQKRYDLQKGLF